MAKPIREGPRRLVPTEREIPMLRVDEPVFFSLPKGLNTIARLSQVPREYAAAMQNLVLDDGTLRSRPGVELWGSVGTDVMAIVGFVKPNGTGQLVRATLTSLERWNGAAWETVAANVFHGTASDYFSFTNFGNELLIANGVDKVFSYNPATGVAESIEDSYPAKHIQTFNGRVILTSVVEGSVKSYRIRWSAKNDSRDWTGDGSGFEDLFAAPGGQVDAAHATIPISDDTALIVRENSIWIMSATGNVLAPHRFSRIVPNIGTRARRSVVEVPGGAAFISHDSVVVAGVNGVNDIGQAIKRTLLSEISDPNDVVARYDTKRQELRIAIGTNVWRYNFEQQGWTKDIYPFTVRDMSYVKVDRLGLSIDALTGTIDALTGTIDELVTATAIEGFFFVGL